MTEMVRGFFEHRGLRLSYLDSAPGAEGRPSVLLLHGFPDTAERMSLDQPEHVGALILEHLELACRPAIAIRTPR